MKRELGLPTQVSVPRNRESCILQCSVRSVFLVLSVSFCAFVVTFHYGFVM
jgi:hypothetical protein